MNPSRLIAWLKRVPPAAARLEIRWDSMNGPQTIASYERAEFEQTVGIEDILNATQDHCDDLRVARSRYECVWLDSAGSVLATKAIVCELSDEAEAEASARDRNMFEGVKTETANAHGLTIALMRHMEVRERMYHSGMAVVVRTAMDTLRDQRGENSELRAENKALRQQLMRAQARSPEESEAETAEIVARAEAWNKVTDAFTNFVLPALMRQVGTPTH